MDSTGSRPTLPARARGGVGLIVTGGIAPNFAGRAEPRASQLSFPWQVAEHRIITDAVHANGGKIAMQILHAGRYAYHPLSVAPSALKSPITPFARAHSPAGACGGRSPPTRAARRSRSAPDTTASRSWAPRATSSTSSSRRRPISATTSGADRSRIASAFRSTSSAARARRWARDFIIIYRLSMLDLVEGGSTWDEVVAARAGDRSRGCDHHQHRHRLARGADPHDRHHGSARRVRVGARGA